jgi:hypothetical protein
MWKQVFNLLLSYTMEAPSNTIPSGEESYKKLIQAIGNDEAYAKLRDPKWKGVIVRAYNHSHEHETSLDWQKYSMMQSIEEAEKMENRHIDYYEYYYTDQIPMVILWEFGWRDARYVYKQGKWQDANGYHGNTRDREQLSIEEFHARFKDWEGCEQALNELPAFIETERARREAEEQVKQQKQAVSNKVNGIIEKQ